MRYRFRGNAEPGCSVHAVYADSRNCAGSDQDDHGEQHAKLDQHDFHCLSIQQTHVMTLMQVNAPAGASTLKTEQADPLGLDLFVLTGDPDRS